MAEYIKRETALSLVQPDAPEDEKAAVTIATAKKLVRDIVRRTPAADVAPVVHGRWIEQRHTFDLPSGGGTCTGTYPTCCLCGAFETGLHLRTAYCPGCGAMMDREDKGND